jgi:hypothetical protein
MFPYHDVYHEYVHFALRNSFSNVPRWLHEGLAEYYSTYSSSSRTALIGRPIERYVKNLDRGGLMPLQDLMTFGWDPDVEVIEHTFYEQAWVTVRPGSSARPGGIPGGTGHPGPGRAVLRPRARDSARADVGDPGMGPRAPARAHLPTGPGPDIRRGSSCRSRWP